ncbi:DUF6074 family protein [Sinorhizobium medicae]|uniref:DUF6074 family protein n=2 Tax=Sinorhizobium medicae TaxID=110321 RepID=UPI0011B6E710|nr:DUF6074 family protein [Sinorhizobium medicae]
MPERNTMPLFNLTPPCKLIAFPLVHRVGKIRRVAEVYCRKEGNERKGYWNAQINQLADHLARLGYPESEIERQLDAFKEAVRCELNRIAYEGHGTGGAA